MKKLSSVLARARSNNESVQSSPDVSRKYGIMGSFSTLGSMLTNVTMDVTAAPEVIRSLTFPFKDFMSNLELQSIGRVKPFVENRINTCLSNTYTPAHNLHLLRSDST